jgi:ligand-binding sensor domain-containing protein
VIRFKDGRFANYTVKEGLATNDIWAVYADSDDNIWIDTTTGELNRFKDGKMHGFPAPKIHKAIRSIYRDRSQVLWLGTSDGLFRVTDQQFTLYATREGLSANEIHGLYGDTDGNLWIGTTDGLKSVQGRQNFIPAYGRRLFLQH